MEARKEMRFRTTFSGLSRICFSTLLQKSTVSEGVAELVGAAPSLSFFAFDLSLDAHFLLFYFFSSLPVHDHALRD